MTILDRICIAFYNIWYTCPECYNISENMLFTIFFTSAGWIFTYSIERNICCFRFYSSIFRILEQYFACLFFSACTSRHSPIQSSDLLSFSFFLFLFLYLLFNYLQFLFNLYLTISLIRILVPLSHFSPSAGRFLFFAPRSSVAPRARDADAVCQTRAFAFSLRVTEHSIEPGRTVPSGRPSLPAYPFLYSALSSRFLSTSRFSGSYPNRERHQHTPVPLIPPPTRIENQFRKTVINGRQSVRSIPLTHAVSHRAACGNRAACEWPLPSEPTARKSALSIFSETFSR